MASVVLPISFKALKELKANLQSYSANIEVDPALLIHRTIGVQSQ